MSEKATGRPDGRSASDLRAIEIIVNFQPRLAGSVLVRWGDTWVLSNATREDRLPPFVKDSGKGWISADYNMLPGSTEERKRRKVGGRETEIKRLIARSLRASIDLNHIDEQAYMVDCDVIQADGGTRVCSIVGGSIALSLALARQTDLSLPTGALKTISAVSVGIVNNHCVLDLPYVEDSVAQVDMNIVMDSDGKFVEIQGCAEDGSFDADQLSEMTKLGVVGNKALQSLQKSAIEAGLAGKNDALARLNEHRSAVETLLERVY